MNKINIILLTLALCGLSCKSEPVPPVNPQTNGVGYIVTATDTDTTISTVNFDWLLVSDPNGLTSTNWTRIASVPYVANQTNYIAPILFTLSTNAPSSPTITHR